MRVSKGGGVHDWAVADLGTGVCGGGGDGGRNSRVGDGSDPRLGDDRGGSGSAPTARSAALDRLRRARSATTVGEKVAGSRVASWSRAAIMWSAERRIGGGGRPGNSQPLRVPHRTKQQQGGGCLMAEELRPWALDRTRV